MTIVAATHIGREFISIGLPYALKPGSQPKLMARSHADSV
jgi:hypothetical protein